MKKIYQSPEVEVMNFAAAEKLAFDINLPIGGKDSSDIEI